MQILPVRDGNGNIVSWEGHNLVEGFSLYLRETQDNSGVICKVVDYYTGHLLFELIGSSVRTVADAALEKTNKFASTPVFAYI